MSLLYARFEAKYIVHDASIYLAGPSSSSPQNSQILKSLFINKKNP